MNNETIFINQPVVRKRRTNRIPFVKTDGGKLQAGFIHETRDCTVRSLALAAGISYADAHSVCAQVGRHSCTGMSDIGVIRAAKLAAQKFGLQVEEIPRPKDPGFKYGPFTIGHGTFAQVVRKYNKGSYILTSDRHAFTIINGTLHDSWHVGGQTRVGLILRVTKAAVPVAPATPTQDQINELWARLDQLEARCVNL